MSEDSIDHVMYIIEKLHSDRRKNIKGQLGWKEYYSSDGLEFIEDNIETTHTFNYDTSHTFHQDIYLLDELITGGFVTGIHLPQFFGFIDAVEENANVGRSSLTTLQSKKTKKTPRRSKNTPRRSKNAPRRSKKAPRRSKKHTKKNKESTKKIKENTKRLKKTDKLIYFGPGRDMG